METYNKFPDIEVYRKFNNPILTSPNTPFELQFGQTKETLQDTELYKRFIENAIFRFRKSVTYKHYKHFLISLGLDRCQMNGNITNEMATIEMHHNMITIFDIAVIITEHITQNDGIITTFDLVKLLKEEHTKHRVQLVMLSKTPHQLNHNTEEFFIHPDMCIGNWQQFLARYPDGITQTIAFKILYFIENALKKGVTDDAGYLKLREHILDWSHLS